MLPDIKWMFLFLTLREILYIPRFVWSVHFIICIADIITTTFLLIYSTAFFRHRSHKYRNSIIYFFNFQNTKETKQYKERGGVDFHCYIPWFNHATLFHLLHNTTTKDQIDVSIWSDSFKWVILSHYDSCILVTNLTLKMNASDMQGSVNKERSIILQASFIDLREMHSVFMTLYVL